MKLKLRTSISILLAIFLILATDNLSATPGQDTGGVPLIKHMVNGRHELIFPIASGRFESLSGPIAARGQVFDHAFSVRSTLTLDVRGKGGSVVFYVGAKADRRGEGTYTVELDGAQMAKGSVRSGQPATKVALDLTGRSSLLFDSSSSIYEDDVFFFDAKWFPAVTRSATVPDLLGPRDGAAVSGESVTLQWSPVAGAQSYGVSVVLVEARQALPPAAPKLWAFTATGASHALDLKPLPAGRYLWSVIAYDGRKAVGGYSREFAIEVRK